MPGMGGTCILRTGGEIFLSISNHCIRGEGKAGVDLNRPSLRIRCLNNTVDAVHQNVHDDSLWRILLDVIEGGFTVNEGQDVKFVAEQVVQEV